MSHSKNLVLYRLCGIDEHKNTVRFPIVSVDADAPLALLTIQRKAMEEHKQCESQGIPLSPLQAIIEEREADEQGKLTKSLYQEVDIMSGEKLGAKPVPAINKLDPKKGA